MNMKNDFVMPILVLSLLCLFMSGFLAVGNWFTQPVIEKAANQRMEEARKELMPQADGFELLDVDMLHRESRLSKAVTAIYRATNDTGYIFMITTLGYGGEIHLICGIDPDGNLIKAVVLSQSETKGFGTPVFDEPHASLFWGRDKFGIEDVPAISGATISSNAFKKGIRESFEAFEIVSPAAHQRTDGGAQQ